jgi:hypothetical protein
LRLVVLPTVVGVRMEGAFRLTVLPTVVGGVRMVVAEVEAEAEAEM